MKSISVRTEFNRRGPWTCSRLENSKKMYQTLISVQGKVKKLSANLKFFISQHIWTAANAKVINRHSFILQLLFQRLQLFPDFELIPIFTLKSLVYAQPHFPRIIYLSLYRFTQWEWCTWSNMSECCGIVTWCHQPEEYREKSVGH